MIINKNGDKLYHDPITGKEYLLMQGMDFSKNELSYDVCFVLENNEELSEEDCGYGNVIGWFAGATLGDDWLDECVASLLTEKHLSVPIGEASAFYTGGGIWLSAMYIDATHYAVVGSDFDRALSFYDHDGEDDDEFFPCQNMTDSKVVNEFSDADKAIYAQLVNELKRQMH